MEKSLRKREIEKITNIVGYMIPRHGREYWKEFAEHLIDNGIRSKDGFEIDGEYLVGHASGEILEQPTLYIRPITYEVEDEKLA